jgi:hypothetical protein
MESPDRLEGLLTEIRDLVREQTDLDREMAHRSVEHQERAMRAIAAGQRFYRKVVVVAALFALLLAASMLGLFG